MIEYKSLDKEKIDFFQKDLIELFTNSFNSSFPNEKFEEEFIIQKVEQCISFYDKGEAFVICAYDTNKNIICGLIYFYEKQERNNKIIHLNHIAVKKEYQKQGIATELISRMEKYAKENKISKISLDVTLENKSAVLLYKKLHFKEIRMHMEKDTII